MEQDSELRQRKQQPVEEQPEETPGKTNEKTPEKTPEKKTEKKKKSKSRSREAEEDDYSLWLDILRVLTFFFVASCALSYVISSGESFFWGMRNKPNYLRVDWWKAQMKGPIYLTPGELATYDGSDSDKPVYLAINGTIYDVSRGRHIYGPGGSYRYFAGCDASRSYVTGCFADDRTPDMRGVEEMFLPLDDLETDAQWTTAEMEKMKAEELAAAEQSVHEALKHWVEFFAKSHKYHKVGYVKREKNWLEKMPKRELCAPARNGRKKRKSRHGDD